MIQFKNNIRQIFKSGIDHNNFTGHVASFIARNFPIDRATFTAPTTNKFAISSNCWLLKLFKITLKIHQMEILYVIFSVKNFIKLILIFKIMDFLINFQIKYISIMSVELLKL